jgi:protein involved in polysaccharide export with SLBB domain
MNMNKFKLLFLFLFVVSGLFAQDLNKLTPEQLEMYKKYMAGKNTTATPAVTPKENVTVRKVDENDSLLTTPKPEITTPVPKLTVFGSNLFNTQNITFEPKLNIPTPPNYILGTYDELVIDISGLYEANYKLKVSTEGIINIPNVGSIKVSGITMENATRTIKNRISKVYMGVPSGETKVNISLGNIRSIRVTVVGEAVRPGSYTLPSLATAINALYSCGGPNDIGSLRDIKVIRAGKVIANLDVYRFLVDGLLIDNVALQDEDVLKIDPYQIRVSFTGAVKHAAIFEGKQDETLKDIIRYAGGFSDNANRSKITVFRFAEKGKTVIDVLGNEMATFKLKSGDSCNVTQTYNKFDNRVDIKGSVYRPGAYALEPGLTVKKLIAKADGIKEDAYLNMAYITRKKENQIPEIIGFNLGEVLKGSAPDVLLQKDDSVAIRSLFDYREGQKVSILGEVKSPGTYPLIENITLKDLIFKARGFTEMASTDSVELIRPIKNQDSLLTSNIKSIVIKFALDKDLNFKPGSGDILLQNGDQVIVRTISGYEGIRMVSIQGEVLHPGSYNIIDKSEKISDIVKRAGGFTRYAYPLGAFLIRSERISSTEQKLNRIMAENSKTQLEISPNKTLDANMLKAAGATTVQGYTAMDSIQKKLSGSQVVEKIFNPEGVVGLNLKEIMSDPGGKYDFKLEEGDIVYVPRELQTVRVLGQVLFPTIVRYDQNMRLMDYINGSGGLSLNADRSKIFVLYPNGGAQSTKSFLGILSYPKIQPGSRIIVPERPIEIKNRLTTGETVSILTSITSTVALCYSILRK